jgi:hypothetical protein
VPARRQYFYHFMRWLHCRLFALTGTDEPLRVTSEISAKNKHRCMTQYAAAINAHYWLTVSALRNHQSERVVHLAHILTIAAMG